MYIYTYTIHVLKMEQISFAGVSVAKSLAGKSVNGSSAEEGVGGGGKVKAKREANPEDDR